MMHQSAPHRIAERRPIGSLTQIAEKRKVPPQIRVIGRIFGCPARPMKWRSETRALGDPERARQSAISTGYGVLGRASARGAVEIFHSRAKTLKGPTLSAPLNVRDLLVAGAGFEPATFGL